MLYSMYMFSQDFGNLGKSVLVVHSYNIWLFLDQILLLLIVFLDLENFHPPLAKGIASVGDTDSNDIALEDIEVVEIVLVDIE